MSILARPYFHDEAAAYQHLEAVLWANGSVCPHCGSLEKPYVLEGVTSRPKKDGKPGKLRYGLKKCVDCGKQFTVTVGTVFESAHIPLHKMLQAVYLMCASKKGISAHQLHRTLEITYKSAWFLAHRIREAMRSGDLGPMGGPGQTVEIDETFFGRLPDVPKPGGGHAHMNTVLSLVNRTTGEARSFHVENATVAQLIPIVMKNIHTESAIISDTGTAYRKRLKKHFASHEMVNHAAKEYVRGDIHTNTIEGFFSIFKRGMRGVYQHCSEKHLHRYLAEFDFRYKQ